MAVHKVPQDVEAEDKFLGPLTFKQFLFFGGALITAYLMYLMVTSPLPFLTLLILPFFIVCVVLAFPWTKDQPTELWLASRIRFMLVPHKRIWDQDDIKDLVTITAPKREVHLYSDGLSQDQVRSRLNALANVVDSRGWAVKNLSGGAGQPDTTDRLSAGTQTPAAAPQHDEPDPLDDHSSHIAQQFDSMIQKSSQQHRQQTRNMVTQALGTQQPAQPTQNPATQAPWFLQQQAATAGGKQSDQTDEQQFLDHVHQKQQRDALSSQNNHMKTIRPAGQQPAGQTPTNQTAQASSPTAVDPATITLAQNNDLNVETIARQANRQNELGDDEVVISLHDN